MSQYKVVAAISSGTETLMTSGLMVGIN